MDALDELSLQEEAMRAGTFYLTHGEYAQGDMQVRDVAGNACAHGFFMGVRWLEKRQRMLQGEPMPIQKFNGGTHV